MLPLGYNPQLRCPVLGIQVDVCTPLPDGSCERAVYRPMSAGINVAVLRRRMTGRFLESTRAQSVMRSSRRSVNASLRPQGTGASSAGPLTAVATGVRATVPLALGPSRAVRAVAGGACAPLAGAPLSAAASAAGFPHQHRCRLAPRSPNRGRTGANAIVRAAPLIPAECPTIREYASRATPTLDVAGARSYLSRHTQWRIERFHCASAQSALVQDDGWIACAKCSNIVAGTSSRLRARAQAKIAKTYLPSPVLYSDLAATWPLKDSDVVEFRLPYSWRGLELKYSRASKRVWTTVDPLELLADPRSGVPIARGRDR